MIEIEPHLDDIISLSFAWFLKVLKLSIEDVRYFYHKLCKDWLVLFFQNILAILHYHSVDTLVHFHHHLGILLSVWVQEIRAFWSQFWRQTCFLGLHNYLFYDIKIIDN